MAAGATLLAPAAATARFVYVAAADDALDLGPGVVSWYQITQAPSPGALGNPGGGPAGTAGGAWPGAIAMDPEGRWAYVANDGPAGDDVYGYEVDPDTGALGQPTITAAGAGVRGIAVSPDGSHLYATTANGEVAHFAISSDDGALTLRDTATAGTDPSGIALSRDGNDAYVADRSGGLAGNGSILRYSVDPDTGALEGPGPVETVESAGAHGIATSPDGGSVYVARRLQNKVDRYDVGEQGSLEGPTASADTARGAFGLAVSPDGESVYVAATGLSNGNAVISQFSVNDSGLEAKVDRDASLPGKAVQGYAAVSVAPDGASVYAPVVHLGGTDPDTYGIAQFDVHQAKDENHGELSPKDPQELGTGATWQPLGIRVAPNRGPTAALAPLAEPATPAGAPVTFDASAATDPDGSVASYRWDFGDGTPVVTTTSPVVSHVYASPGQYQVGVTVTDNEGCSDRFVFAGQTAYCNGSQAAQASMTVRVDAASGGSPGAPAPPALPTAPDQPSSGPLGPAQLSRTSMTIRCSAPPAKRAAGKRRARLIGCQRSRPAKPRLLVRFTASAAASIELKVMQLARKGKKGKASKQRVVLRRTLAAKAGANTLALPIRVAALRGRLSGELAVAGAKKTIKVKVIL